MRQLLSVNLFNREDYDKVLDYIKNVLGAIDPIINDGSIVDREDHETQEEYEEEVALYNSEPQIVFVYNDETHNFLEIKEYLEGLNGVEEVYES